MDLVKITGNQIDGGRDGIRVFVNDANVQQFRITDNDIHDVGLDGTGDGINVRYGTSAAPASAVGTLIQGNTVRDAEGMGIEVHSTRYVISNLSVDGNTIDRGQGRGIMLIVGGATNNASRNLVGVSVNDNCLTNCGDDRSLPIVEIQAGATSGADPTINGLSVSGNQILACGGNDGSTAILVDLQPTQWQFATNIRVDNNCIFGGQYAAIPSLDDLVGTGIDLTLPVFDLVSVCGNEIHFKGYTNAGTDSFGIRVELYDDGSSLNINRNTIRDFGGTASVSRKAIFVDTPPTGDTTFRDVSVDDNMVEGFVGGGPDTSYGIHIFDDGQNTDTGFWNNTSISRNQITEASYSLVLESGQPGNRQSTFTNLNVDNNQGRDWVLGGFWLEGNTLLGVGGKLFNVSVSNNEFVTNRLPTTDAYGIRFTFGTSAAVTTYAGAIRNLSVNNNKVHYFNTNDNENNGIWFNYSFGEPEGTALNIQFHGNQISNCRGSCMTIQFYGGVDLNAQNEITDVVYMSNLSVAGNQLERPDDAESWLGANPEAQPSNFNIYLYGISLQNFHFRDNTSDVFTSGGSVRNLAFTTTYGASATDFADTSKQCFNWIIQGNIARVTGSGISKTIQALWGQWLGAVVTANAKPNNILISSNYYVKAGTAASDEWEAGADWYDPATDDINVSTKGL